MSAVGQAKISLVNPENMESYLIDFNIVDENFAPLLGLDTAQKMSYWLCKLRIFCPLEKTHRPVMLRSLSSRDAVMSEYSDGFGEEFGCMEGKVHLETDPNVAPPVMPPRRVPVLGNIPRYYGFCFHSFSAQVC